MNRNDQLLSSYDRLMQNPKTARLIRIEKKKLDITEYLAEKYKFYVPDDEEFDKLLDALTKEVE